MFLEKVVIERMLYMASVQTNQSDQSSKDDIVVILELYRECKAEILERHKFEITLPSIFFTIAAAIFAYIFIDGNQNGTINYTVHFLMSMISIMVSFFGMNMFSTNCQVLAIHEGYASFLEDELNKKTSANYSVFLSKLTPYIYTKKRPLSHRLNIFMFPVVLLVTLGFIAYVPYVLSCIQVSLLLKYIFWGSYIIITLSFIIYTIPNQISNAKFAKHSEDAKKFCIDNLKNRKK